MNMKITGTAWKYGDNVNTDYILPGRYMELTDPDEIAKHAMEGIDQSFVTKVQNGDIVVGGTNFGCGSSREHAPLALKHVGIGCIIAESYARIFYRNAINIGLTALECKGITTSVDHGDTLELDLDGGVVSNLIKGHRLKFTRIPPFMLEILKAGGLVPFLSNLDEW
jgi:3-isopropylmalate/(R)-2-methylmalate dehydratase small subunit